MVDVKFLHGKWFVWFDDKLFIVTTSLTYASRMAEVLR